MDTKIFIWRLILQLALFKIIISDDSSLEFSSTKDPIPTESISTDLPTPINQSNKIGPYCRKDINWILANRRIIFMSLVEDFPEIEILPDETASDSIVKLLSQIAYMLDCDDKDHFADPTNFRYIMFPAHYSYSEQRLSDVYVAVQRRCTDSIVCQKPITETDINKLVGDMFDHYLSKMPRTHYGYGVQNETDPMDSNKCLDESGYITPSLGGITGCFSLYMADGNRKAKNGFHVDYYGGQLAFNRVDQDSFVVGDNVSIPQVFYKNDRMSCAPGKEGNPLQIDSICHALLTADTYAMLCCCHSLMERCHMPNKDSFHRSNVNAPVRPKQISDLYKNTGEKKDQITCAVGEINYEGNLERGDNGSSKVNWISTHRLYTTKHRIFGTLCRTVYKFAEGRLIRKKDGHHHHEPVTNFTMRMSADTVSACDGHLSSQFLCILNQQICAEEKPTCEVLKEFQVTCCCGKNISDISSVPETGTQDLCNLDFLSLRVQDNFKQVLNSPLCSYSSHYHRLFGRYSRDFGRSKKHLCVVNYDVNLKKIVYLLDGNNFHLMFDNDFRSHRENLPMLVYGYILPIKNCSDNNPYKEIMKRANNKTVFRGIYMHKCDPLGSDQDPDNPADPQCDIKIESKIDHLFEENKANVMRKCFKFNTFEPVITKEQLDQKMRTKEEQVYSTESFLCFALIKSTIVTQYDRKGDPIRRNMEHTIEAGPITAIHIEKVPEHPYYRECINMMTKKDNGTLSDYCTTDFNLDPKNISLNALLKQNMGTSNNSANRNTTIFCCCFVGLGWEDCKIKDRIVHQVLVNDLKRDKDTITEALGRNMSCHANAMKEGKDLKFKIANYTLEECIRPQGCFRIYDVKDKESLRRFEIWSGCISNIPSFVQLSARASISYLCTFVNITKEANTKCLAVDLGRYFEQAKLPNEKYFESGTAPERMTVICCCWNECDTELVKKQYKFFRVNNETNSSGQEFISLSGDSRNNSLNEISSI